MEITYRLTINELTTEFVNLLKKQYKEQTLTINIGGEMDETEYLLASKANREVLMKRLKNVEEKKNLVSVKLKDL